MKIDLDLKCTLPTHGSVGIRGRVSRRSRTMDGRPNTVFAGNSCMMKALAKDWLRARCAE